MGNRQDWQDLPSNAPDSRWSAPCTGCAGQPPGPVHAVRNPNLFTTFGQGQPTPGALVRVPAHSGKPIRELAQYPDRFCSLRSKSCFCRMTVADGGMRAVRTVAQGCGRPPLRKCAEPSEIAPNAEAAFTCESVHKKGRSWDLPKSSFWQEEEWTSVFFEIHLPIGMNPPLALGWWAGPQRVRALPGGPSSGCGSSNFCISTA